MSVAEEVSFQPYDQAFAANPYPTYARLRAGHPIFHSAEFGMTFFLRFHDISRLLVDKRLGRTMNHTLTADEIAANQSAPRWQSLPNYNRYVRVNLLETEGRDHSRIRKLLAAAINPRRIRLLSDRVQQVVDELMAKVRGLKTMDFLTELAVPLPVFMIAELLGWPADERHRLRPWSAAIVRLYEKDCTAEDEERAENATGDFAAMLDGLADSRLEEPRDDLISALVAKESHEDSLTRDEVIATCMLLLNAGHEATVNAAGNGLLALLRHPNQMERLKENPGMIKTALEEILRYDSPLHLFHRFVLEDGVYRGVELKRGDAVGLLYGSANRDPEAFDAPDTFDIGRQPNRHLAFGAGTHFCLGAPLARLELEILFRTLLEQIPNIELADEQPDYHTGLVFRGLKGLSIRW